MSTWRVVDGRLRAEFRAAGFPAGAALLAAIADEAERRDHHPDLTLTYPGTVTVVVWSHDVQAVTGRDHALAAAIDALAAERGATPT